MFTAPLSPQTSSYLVDSSAAVQIPALAGGGSMRQYRIRSKNAGEGYIGYAAPKPDASTPAVNTTLPIVGTPQAGILGMNGGVTETFTFPAGTWFKAAAGMTFEVIAGEGA